MVGRPYIALPQNGKINGRGARGKGINDWGSWRLLERVVPVLALRAGLGSVVGRVRHGHETSRAASSLGRAFSVRARAGPMGLA